MNAKALLTHYKAALEVAIAYVQEQRDAAKKAADFMRFSEATDVLNKLERAIEIGNLVEVEDSFRPEPEPARAPAARPRNQPSVVEGDDVIIQDGEPVQQVEPRPEDYLPTPTGAPPRLGTGMKSLRKSKGL